MNTLVLILDRLWVCSMLLLDILQGNTHYNHTYIPTSSAIYDIHKNTVLAWVRLQGVVNICQGGDPSGGSGSGGGMRGAVSAAFEEILDNNNKSKSKTKGKNIKGPALLLDPYHICLMISDTTTTANSGCRSIYTSMTTGTKTTVITTSSIYAQYNWSYTSTTSTLINTHIHSIITTITKQLVTSFIYTYPTDKDVHIFKKSLKSM